MRGNQTQACCLFYKPSVFWEHNLLATFHTYFQLPFCCGIPTSGLKKSEQWQNQFLWKSHTFIHRAPWFKGVSSTLVMTGIASECWPKKCQLPQPTSSSSLHHATARNTVCQPISALPGRREDCEVGSRVGSSGQSLLQNIRPITTSALLPP